MLPSSGEAVNYSHVTELKYYALWLLAYLNDSFLYQEQYTVCGSVIYYMYICKITLI